MNPTALFKVKSAWEKFAGNHPKFPMFLSAAAQSGIKSGDIIELKITKEDGNTLCTNVKLTESDMELFSLIKEIGTSGK